MQNGSCWTWWNVRDNAITELAEEYSFILKSAKILK